MALLVNPNPTIYEISETLRDDSSTLDVDALESYDHLEVFDIIRKINDPEHPLTLEQLNVVKKENVRVENEDNNVVVFFLHLLFLIVVWLL